MAESSDAVVQIAYDGSALANGTMDVRDLAPALLAIGDLIQNANHVFNGERARIAVNVRSDFKTGSFQVDLELVVGLAAQVQALFGRDGWVSAKDIAEYLGLITGADVSLFGLLKWLKGRTPAATTTLKNGDFQLTVTVNGDNNNITVSPEVFALANDPAVRKAVGGVVKPLHSPGVDQFQVRHGAKVTETVNRDDLVSFELPKTIDTPVDSESAPRLVALEVIKPSFHEDLVWTLSDGSGGRINARMLDKDFAERVQQGLRTFGKGDVLKVLLVTRQFFTSEGLRTEHDVVEVIGEVNAPRQQSLMPQPKFPTPPPLGADAKRRAKMRRRRKT